MFSCAAKPMQLTADEAANYKDVQLTRASVAEHRIVRNLGVVREDIKPGVGVNEAQKRMQLETYRRGGNAIYDLRASGNYLQGDAVLIEERMVRNKN